LSFLQRAERGGASKYMDTGKNLKVLVVDDAYFMRELIIKELKEFGCEVIGEAKNGLEAIRMYKKYKPDLVTMDIKMPEMDGIKAIKEIKSINPSASIIVITGVYDSKKEAFKAGADDFLKKPFQPAFLWQKIEKLIEKKANNENAELANETAEEKVEQQKSFDTNKEKSNESIVIVESGCEDDLLGLSSSDEEEFGDIVFEISSESNTEEFIIETEYDNQDSIYLEKSEIEDLNDDIHSDKHEERGEEEGDDIDEDDNLIMISIKPPRNAQYRKSNYSYDLKENREDVKAPILNYVEENEEEEPQVGFLDKIKKLLKIN